MKNEEVVKVLKEYYDEANVGGQPNKYLIRKQQVLSTVIEILKRIDDREIEDIIFHNLPLNFDGSDVSAADKVREFISHKIGNYLRGEK